MTAISECTAPDLTDLKVPVLANYFLNIVFAGRGGSDNPIVRAYAHGLIRTVDKSVREYNAGRQCLIEYSTSANRTALLFEGLDHMETCISTVKRSLGFADRMAVHPENPEISRTTRRRLNDMHRLVRPVRDAVEHMDKDITSGCVQAGEAHMLSVSRNGSELQIGAHKLPFSELASALRELHAIAYAVSQRDRKPDAQTAG